MSQELLRISERLSGVAAQADDSSFSVPLARLKDAATAVSESWSQSNIGFHANVYYEGLTKPPAGAHFSAEWGFSGVFQGSTGSWKEFTSEVIKSDIRSQAENPDLSRHHKDAKEATKIVEDARDEVLSILRTSSADDEHTRELTEDIQKCKPVSEVKYARAFLPKGALMTRDSTALSQGLRPAPHQELLAEIFSIESPFEVAAELSQLCRRAARHLARLRNDTKNGDAGTARRVFIGHGQSPVWRELKDFIADDLGLAWDEFNRVSTAGVATANRLTEMQEDAAFAFLIATAEDETASGEGVARQNVVHEIGLFQGHLGSGRAIILLEDGCAEFSNIHGVGQIRFPKNKISACFHDVRRVLKREGLI